MSVTDKHTKSPSNESDEKTKAKFKTPRETTFES